MPTFSVGGTVIGLAGTGLVLENNGGDATTIGSNGAFAFPTAETIGQPYAVTVAGQPSSPLQVCTVTNATGTLPGMNVANIVVSCVTTTFTVSASITGLSGAVVLADNASDTLTETTDGTFAFGQAVASDSPYSVTVIAQPSGQTCVVTAGSGTITSQNVAVDVTCAAPTFTVGGVVTGISGAAIVLLDNGGDELTVPANGSFTFPTALSNGMAYAVTVKTPPPGMMTCTVSAGRGTIDGANVSSAAVNCSSGAFSIGGTIVGLAPDDSVELEVNGADSTFFSFNGQFAFAAPLFTGDSYAVTVQSNPATPTAQTCAVSSGSGGPLQGMGVSSVLVTCVTNSYTVSGWVTLVGTGGDSITLRNNGADAIVLQPGAASPAQFTFATPILSGSSYSVVATLSGGTAVTCTSEPVGTLFQGVRADSASSGTVGGQNVAAILIECAP